MCMCMCFSVEGVCDELIHYFKSEIMIQSWHFLKSNIFNTNIPINVMTIISKHNLTGQS